MSADGSIRGVGKVLNTKLTQREAECLSLVAGGQTAKQIARTLHLAQPTVVYYLDQAKAKLGAVNRTNAVVIALTEHRITYPSSQQFLPVQTHTNACASGRCVCQRT